MGFRRYLANCEVAEFAESWHGGRERLRGWQGPCIDSHHVNANFRQLCRTLTLQIQWYVGLRCYLRRFSQMLRFKCPR